MISSNKLPYRRVRPRKDKRAHEKVPILCKMCGTKIRTLYPTRQRYCSIACRSRAQRSRIRYRAWKEEQRKLYKLQEMDAHNARWRDVQKIMNLSDTELHACTADELQRHVDQLRALDEALQDQISALLKLKQAKAEETAC